MSDLFISYSSHDRPWAERLYRDIKAKFRSTTIFLDVEAIRASVEYAPVLEREVREAKYFVVLWSDKAKESNEVGPEVQAFLAHNHTRADVLYIALKGSAGLLLEGIEGFPDFKTAYDAEATDRGVAKIDAEPYRLPWRRMLRKIGNKIEDNDETQPVKLAVYCMRLKDVAKLQGVLDTEKETEQDAAAAGNPRPSTPLQEFFQGTGLDLGTVTPRYGETALDWKPFGTDETIVDFMDDLRVEANSKLKEEFRFHWDWREADLFNVMRTTQSPLDLQQKLDALTAGPSLVLFDPLTLHNPLGGRLFQHLSDYASREQSMIMSLNPVPEKHFELIYPALQSSSAPVLNGYFVPQIPPVGAFARCGVNLQHKMDVERLLRISLGSFHLQKKASENKAVLSLGG